MTFELIRLRFHLRAGGSPHFPPGKAGNTLRGAFGILLRQTAGESDYSRIFEPKSQTGPSGLADPPRPFVIRAAHLDGRILPSGAEFHFDVHLFDLAPDRRPLFVAAFARVAEEGLGAGRTQAELLSVVPEPISIDFDDSLAPATRLRVAFLTPTELKNAPRPEFPVLFARLRDRISTLRALYGPGPLDIDFRAMGERAARIQLTRCDLTWHATERRSSRTGQTHSIGGFTGEADYDGDLTEFLPYLRAGQWTGVGRQTVWEKEKYVSSFALSRQDLYPPSR